MVLCLLSVNFILLFIILNNLNISYLLSSVFVNYLGSTNIIYCYSFDYVSCMCLFMLLICFLIASYFYWHYFNWHSDYLIINIQIFVLSMFYLVCSNSIINSFIGWEYLGLSSFFLILYYSIYCSSRSALITMISSRFGDLGFFILIFYLTSDNNFNCWYIYLLVLLLLISKTAVYPMSSWLLEAMRAPTPVSSLVHSSTLVASGVWLICRYNYVLINENINIYLFILSLISIFISGSSAFFNMDTKKVIALSTCNNISWCYIYIYLGDINLGLIQLASHGIFKCIMFCLIGDLLVNSNNNQSKSFHFISNSLGFSFIISIIILFISGFPYMGLFFSKHIFLSLITSSNNLFIVFMLFLSIGLSFLYSLRLLHLVNNQINGCNEGFSNGFFLSIVVLPISLLMNSLLSGSVLESDINSSYLNIIINLIILFFSLGGYIINFYSINNWTNSLLGQDYLINLFSSISLKIEGFVLNLTLWRWETYLFSIINGSRIESNLSFINYFLVVCLLFYLIILALYYNINIYINILSFQVNEPG